jgi:hypothetical protein
MVDFREKLSNQDNETELHPEGLLFTGALIRELTPEQIEAIGEVASRLFGLEAQVMQSLESEPKHATIASPERVDEPKRLPVTDDDFHKFAAENGYTKHRAGRAWSSVYGTTFLTRDEDLFPKAPVELIPHEGDEAVDLKDIYIRLIDSGLRSNAWMRGSTGTVAFLADMINKIMKLESPLPLSAPKRRATQWGSNV